MHMRAASSVVSLTTHVMVVAAAVWATTEAHNLTPSTPVRFVEVAAPKGPIDESSTAGLPIPTIDGRVDVPPIEPPTIGGIDTRLPPFTVDVPSGPGPLFAGRTPGDGTPLEASLADELPVMLAGPSAAYPDLLRQAGVHGRVVLEAVIDTLGRVEPGSVVVVESAHPAFVAPVQHSLLASLFRPARVSGRAVRVRVRLAFDFVLRDARL
jgi:hypothetical protein